MMAFACTCASEGSLDFSEQPNAKRRQRALRLISMACLLANAAVIAAKEVHLRSRCTTAGFMLGL
jgi:hypothetical protein